MDIEVETTSDSAGRRMLRITGAIDVQSRIALTTAARAAFQSGAPAVVLDLAGVTFMDSTGIGALVQMSHDAEDAGATLTIQNPSDRVVRILEMTGLDAVWIKETA